MVVPSAGQPELPIKLIMKIMVRRSPWLDVQYACAIDLFEG